MDAESLVGYFLVLGIFILGLFVVMRDTISTLVGVTDPTLLFLLNVTPLIFFIAIITGIVMFAMGHKPVGAE